MKKKVIIPLITLFIFMITTTCVFVNTIENQLNPENQNINPIANEAPDLDIERVGIVEQSQETDNLLEKFAPYQDIIDKINKEFNTDVIGIADDRALKYVGKTREDVYKDTIGRDLNEFENSLRNDYIEAQKSLAEININSDGKRRSLDNNPQYDKAPEYITFQ